MAPVAGGSGKINADSITVSSVDLSWVKASDNKTAEADLEYMVVYTKNDNIDTVDNAIYFNVIISDEAWNKAIYTTPSKKTLERSSDRKDDKVINAGVTTTETVDDKKVTTVAVDDKMIEEKLAAEGDNATVIIPVNNGSNVVIGELNGQTVKNMETKAAMLKIETGYVTYTLPASEIKIDSVSEQLGQQVDLKDIKIRITIAEPPADTVKIVEDSANMNSYQIAFC